MANANFDSTSITSKAISLVVAIVVFACVLVPVIGSMTGGGDGGGSEDGPTVLTNTGQTYALADSGTHTMTVGVENNEFVLTVDGETVDADFDYVQRDGEATYNSIPKLLLTKGVDTVSEETEIDSVWLDQFGRIWYNQLALKQVGEGYSVEFEFTDGEMMVTDMYDGDWNIYVQYYISTVGDYVMAETPQVFANTEICVEYLSSDAFMVTVESSSSTDTYPFTLVAQSTGNLNTLIESMDWGLTTWDWDGNAPTYSLPINYMDYTTIELDLTPMNGYYVLNGITASLNMDATASGNGESYSGEAVIDKFIVPKTTTLDSSVVYDGPGADSGSDSDSGSGSGTNSGITGTLIGIIPVFVALGLILAIVGMFYNPKMD